MNIFFHSQPPHTRGYVALITVSIMSFVMLILVLGISEVSMRAGEYLVRVETLRRARVVALSCVSVIREKVAENTFFGAEFSRDRKWLLRDGACDVHILNEDLRSGDVRITATALDAYGTMSTRIIRLRISKDTYRVEKLSGSLL